jgi:nitric oxide dioxygenase
MAAVSIVVGSLDDLAQILGSIRSLGRRHASYGVKPRHFELAGIALLATTEWAMRSPRQRVPPVDDRL